MYWESFTNNIISKVKVELMLPIQGRANFYVALQDILMSYLAVDFSPSVISIPYSTQPITFELFFC